jgi:putative two-component system response regulator
MTEQIDIKSAGLLIVDDEPVNVKLLEKVLSVSGYNNLHSTTDPRDVIAMCEAAPPDLILLDINMPYLDGYQVMAQLKQHWEDEAPPVLVLTAQADQASRIQALELGARDFVSKPFDRVELLARIRNLLEVNLFHRQVKEQNRLLEDKVRERTRELEDTRLEITRRLGRAAEYRDNETGLHIIRMSKISQLLAQAAGMNERDAGLLLNASPMHDIGKIGIPDCILQKPGKLDPEEWQIMKTHADIGAKILSGHDSDLLTMARLIALTHHEKWDGSGYPRGLKGEDIPLVGRIVALADVFDALTSVRPYKHAWSIEEAVVYIRDNSGIHFDPQLVRHFMKLLPQILAIKEEYAEPGTDVGGLEHASG